MEYRRDGSKGNWEPGNLTIYKNEQMENWQNGEMAKWKNGNMAKIVSFLPHPLSQCVLSAVIVSAVLGLVDYK